MSSDFYRSRRIAIKDTTALLTFFIGFVWSGAFVWPFMQNQIDQGEMIRGLAYFLGAVLVCAIGTGLLGLEAGNLLGGVWERYHRTHRAPATIDASPALALAAPFGFRMPARGATRFVAQFPSYESDAHGSASAVATKDVSGVYYTDAGVFAASFIPLAERVRPMRYDVGRTREALSRTTNIGAWDGPRLVGVVRVLSDGYTYSALTDIMVDPEYQMLGIGRSLMQRALHAAPDLRLVIDAPPECAGFFARIGCDPSAPGFVMRPGG